jgi:hypothetical protein
LSLAGVSGDLGTRIASTVAWGVALAAVVLILVLLLRRLRRRAPAPADVPGRIEPSLPSTAWTARVAAALERGDLREASRAAYLAAVVRLEEQGVWRVDQARTPREYTRLVAPADPRRLPFSELAGEFERAWYGNRPADTARLWQWLEGCGCARS